MLVKANIEVVGFRGSRKDLAIVDTGSSLTLLDEIVAGDIVGLATLEILGLTPNVKTGELEKVGALAL